MQIAALLINGYFDGVGHISELFAINKSSHLMFIVRRPTSYLRTEFSSSVVSLWLEQIQILSSKWKQWANINVRSFIAHRISATPLFLAERVTTSQARLCSYCVDVIAALSLGGFLQGQKLSIELNFIVRETLSQRTHQTLPAINLAGLRAFIYLRSQYVCIVTILNSGVLNVKAHAVQQITKCSVKGMNHIQI
ncbi:Hypothetical_protein [Hexamita inflata]|uniref:Hypothetical_protein n=1 Tax=Hexamita inflata TaxID=28002 RepID=A0AA86PE84_9EUKA|nr:Hypothetical protein HINF_LOCUS24582 [Hexamita inflata]